MTTETDADVVTLKGGVLVSVAALRLALDLESRGIALRVEDDSLIVNPRQLVSDDDVAQLRKHRADLKRIASYRVPEL